MKKEKETNVPEEQKEKEGYFFPWKGLIFIGIIIVLMIVCVIVILCNGGFYQWSK